MKNLIFTLLALIPGSIFSQVIIGDQTGTAANKNSVLIEFAAGQNKGIVLPYVRTLPSGSNLTEGTLVLNVTDPTKARVMFYNGGWVDLSSGHEANISAIMSSQPSAVTELTSSKAVIGDASTTADGVLVLEATDKAMVLPMVTNTNSIADPAPGMMVYLNVAGSKRLAVYNGGGWTYWKP